MTNQVEVVQAQIAQSRQKMSDLEDKVNDFAREVEGKRFLVGPSYAAVVVSFEYSANDSESDNKGMHPYLAFSKGEMIGKVYVLVTSVNGSSVALTQDLLNSIGKVKRDIMHLARDKDILTRRELDLAQREHELLRAKLRTAYHSEEIKEEHDNDADLFCAQARPSF